jgi:hypothetical protein
VSGDDRNNQSRLPFAQMMREGSSVGEAVIFAPPRLLIGQTFFHRHWCLLSAERQSPCQTMP